MSNVILAGKRPTGKLHFGHFSGSLNSTFFCNILENLMESTSCCPMHRP